MYCMYDCTYVWFKGPRMVSCTHLPTPTTTIDPVLSIYFSSILLWFYIVFLQSSLLLHSF